MARLTAISGLGGKFPAAFLLEVGGKRILLDLGEGPEPGIFPDVSELGMVDAICLSHAHIDHAGALHLATKIGHPPLHATHTTFRQIGIDPLADPRCRILPEQSEANIETVPVTVGRCGHSPGGIWFHFAADGGVLYTGDWSVESQLLPFDMPPPADLLVTDASYGDRQASLRSQVDTIAELAREGAVLPVPSFGRGPELALALAERGLPLKVSAQIRNEIVSLADNGESIGAPLQERLNALLAGLPNTRKADWRPSDILIVTEANGEAGTSAELVARIDEGFRFIFSSHVPHGTPAERLIAEKKASWLGWNVHPRLEDVLHLADMTGARRVMPVFVKPADMPILAEKLGNRLVLDRSVETDTCQSLNRGKCRMNVKPQIPHLTEDQEDRLAVLFPVLEETGSHGMSVFIGNKVAAEDAALLQENNITSTMNLAINIEVAPMSLPNGSHVRRTHIGLIDGPGNTPEHLLASVFAIRGLAGQDSPGKAHYPAHRRGNLLVHCRGGRSRSATAIALYMHLFHPDRFATIEAAVDHVRQVRGLDTTQPQPAMLDMANAAIEIVRAHRLPGGS